MLVLLLLFYRVIINYGFICVVVVAIISIVSLLLLPLLLLSLLLLSLLLLSLLLLPTLLSALFAFAPKNLKGERRGGREEGR